MVSFHNPFTFVSTLNTSGNTTLNSITIVNSSFNVSGNTTLNDATTITSSLNDSGNTTLIVLQFVDHF